jgi:hypothetical protein
MSIRTRVYHLLNGLALLGLLLAPMQPLMQPSATPARAQAAPSASETGLFRTRVVVRNPPDWARLDKLGVVVLETTTDGGPPSAV